MCAMEATKNQLRDVKVRRFTRQREDAERAIEVAIGTLEQGKPTHDQLGDVADAIDALKQRQFTVAVRLAQDAVHSTPVGSKRPSVMARTLDEMKSKFEFLRSAEDA